jgi:Flp pilus assembly protein TadD
MGAIDRAKAVDAIYAAGHFLFTNDRVPEALDVFRTMLLAAPTDDRGWLGLGACHESIGEDDRALDIYRVARRAISRRARIEIALARSLRARGDLGDASDAYARAADFAAAEERTDLLVVIEQESTMP